MLNVAGQSSRLAVNRGMCLNINNRILFKRDDVKYFNIICITSTLRFNITHNRGLVLKAISSGVKCLF